jgi:hypothetical protein
MGKVHECSETKNIICIYKSNTLNKSTLSGVARSVGNSVLL